MPTLYKIAGWQKHFETHESRKLQRLPWVAIPTKHDGLGFRTLAAQKNAGDLYAAWILMVQIASKGRKDERGTLARDGRALSASDLSLMTGFPARIFDTAFAFFSQPLVGWLVAEPSPGNLPASAGTPADEPENLPAHNITGQDRTVVGPTASAQRRAAEAAPATVSDWVAELQGSEAYAHIDVAKEFAKMQVWCRTHRRQPTRRRFVAWLNRIEPPLRPTGPISTAPRLPEAPKDWRLRLVKLYPDASPDLSWATLTPEIRKQILKIINTENADSAEKI